MVANILQIAGAISFTAGVTMIFPPAGFIVAGIFAILFGLSMERR